MKTFKDLKEGDIMYYYDHGKMHAQVVKSVRTGVYKFQDCWGTEYARDQLFIKAGKGREYNYEWLKFQEDAVVGSSHRFASKEAAKKYIDNMRHNALRKMEYLQIKMNKYKKMIENYNDVSFD